MPNRDLIKRAVSGDEMAITRILLTFEHPLLQFIHSVFPQQLQSKFSPEDVLQETQAQVAIKIQQFRGDSEGELWCWSKRIAKHQLDSMCRAQRAQKRGGEQNQMLACGEADSTLDPVEQLLADSRDSPRRTAERAERERRLTEQLAHLPTDYAQAIELFHIQHLDLKAVAERMGKTEAAIRGLLDRGKKQLKQHMGNSSQWRSSAS